MRLCRVGLRKSLGWDALRRRYWALGGAAGAWRVYVEEDDGKRWGWYDGEGPSLAILLSVARLPSSKLCSVRRRDLVCRDPQYALHISQRLCYCIAGVA